MNKPEIAAFMPADTSQAILQEISITGTLSGLYSEVEVTQCYRNPGEVNIETVLTLALPQEAVLLGLDLTIGERRLEGVVKARKQAEHDYEAAVCEGDSALMVVEVEPGVFSVTLANLLPQEIAVVRFRYAELHRWAGDTLRFYLPLTLAPRYGRPDPMQFPAELAPAWSFDATHTFKLLLNIKGPLAQGDLDCPSHPVQIDAKDGGLQLAVDGSADTLMNRDFILNFAKPALHQATLTTVPDGEQRLVHACIQPTNLAIAGGARRCFQILVDCSGSMAGDSIVQARRAMVEILKRLVPEDMFNIIRFGNTQESLASVPLKATALNILRAQKFIARMDADLGGTQIDAAFERVHAQRWPKKRSTEILLITDGHVHNPEQIAHKLSERTNCRVFSIGVGSSVSEGVLTTLARRTGGHAELVSPREGFEDRVLRQFERMRQPKATHATLEWGAQPSRVVDQDLQHFFGGDTLHLFAFFPDTAQAISRCTLTVEFDDGQSLRLIARRGDTEPDALQADLPRMAIAHELRNAKNPDPALAEQYQILCRETAFILVMPRAEVEKPVDLPELKKIPHITPAGFAGMGRIVVEDRSFHLAESETAYSAEPWMDMPAFLRRQNDIPEGDIGSQTRASTPKLAIERDASDAASAQDAADHPGRRFSASKRRLKRMFKALRNLCMQSKPGSSTAQQAGTAPRILEEADLDALIASLNAFVTATPDQADIARACRSLTAFYAAVDVPDRVMHWFRDLNHAQTKGDACLPEASVIAVLIHWLCEHRGSRFDRTARRRLIRVLPISSLQPKTRAAVSARLPDV